MNKMQKAFSFILILSLILTTLFNGETSQAIRKMKKPIAKVSSVKITNVRKKLRIQKGKKFRLKTSIKVKPNKSNYKKLKFSSSNRNVILVNSRGLIKGVKVGTAKITAASKTNPKKKASISVSVTKDVLVSSIKLNKTKIIADEFNEDEIKLRVKKILPSNAKNKKVKWTTSDEEVADVDEEGVVTTGDAGTATITATAADQGGASAICKVIVEENADGDTEDDDSEETEIPSTTSALPNVPTMEPTDQEESPIPEVTASCEPTPDVPEPTVVASEIENPGGTILPPSKAPTPIQTQQGETPELTAKPTVKPTAKQTEKPVKTPRPEWTPDPDKQKEVKDITLTYGNGEGYRFEKAAMVRFDEADNYPSEGIDVRYYDKVIVKYTSDKELTRGDEGWGGKATLSSTAEGLRQTSYTDGLYFWYLGDLAYNNGGYGVEYNIKEVGKVGGLNNGFDFEDVGLIDCVSVQLESNTHPYVDSEDGRKKGVNLRLQSIEFKADPLKSTAKPINPGKDFDVLKKVSIESRTKADAQFLSDGSLEINYEKSPDKSVWLDLGKGYDLSEYTGIELTGKAPGQMKIELYDDSMKMAGCADPFHYASCAWRFENGEFNKAMSVVNGFVTSDGKRALASEETCTFTWKTLERWGKVGDRSKIRYIYLKPYGAPVAQEGKGFENSDKYVIRSLKFITNQINKDVLPSNSESDIGVIFPKNEKGKADISYSMAGAKFGSEETVAAWYLDMLKDDNKTEENHNTAFDMSEFSYMKITVGADLGRIDLKLAGQGVSYEDAVFVGSDEGVGARTLYFSLDQLKKEGEKFEFDTVQVCVHGGTIQSITAITGFPVKKKSDKVSKYIVNPDGSKRELTEMDTSEWRPYYFDSEMPPDPFEPQGEGWKKVDLSQWSGNSYCYSREGKQIALDDTEFESIPLPINLDQIGQRMEVIVRGSIPEASEGVRFWLTNDTGATMTDQYYYTKKGVGLGRQVLDDKNTAKLFHPGESFQLSTILENVNWDGSDDSTVKRIGFKGSTYGEILYGVVITGVWVRPVKELPSNTAEPDMSVPPEPPWVITTSKPTQEPAPEPPYTYPIEDRVISLASEKTEVMVEDACWCTPMTIDLTECGLWEDFLQLYEGVEVTYTIDQEDIGTAVHLKTDIEDPNRFDEFDPCCFTSGYAARKKCKVTLDLDQAPREASRLFVEIQLLGDSYTGNIRLEQVKMIGRKKSVGEE